MEDELNKAADHVAAIREGLNAIKAHAQANGDQTLLDLEADLHQKCEAARADYLEARNAGADVAASFSGGEEKPASDQPSAG